MKIELWPVSRVQPYPNNPRLNDDAVEAVATSIREFGFRQAIVVDAQGVIIVGHTRWKAAQKLGLETVPVHVAQDLTAEQIRAYRIADNQSATLSTWDYGLLPIELGELHSADFDLNLLGFDPDELAKLLDPGAKEGLADPDDVPEPPEEAITQPGGLVEWGAGCPWGEWVFMKGWSIVRLPKSMTFSAILCHLGQFATKSAMNPLRAVTRHDVAHVSPA